MPRLTLLMLRLLRLSPLLMQHCSPVMPLGQLWSPITASPAQQRWQHLGQLISPHGIQEMPRQNPHGDPPEVVAVSVQTALCFEYPY